MKRTSLKKIKTKTKISKPSTLIAALDSSSPISRGGVMLAH